jgi:metal-sulfur cluster biosynthetic enzyme
MVMIKNNEKEILNLLKDVLDPEIPVLNIVEMGIVRDVIFDEKGLLIKMTPTYMGCPAMNTIENDILDILIFKRDKKCKSKNSLFTCVDNRLDE